MKTLSLLAPTTARGLETTTGNVTACYGTGELAVPMSEGMTVGEVLALVKGPLDVPAEAPATIGGVAVSLNRVVLPAERVEFIKVADVNG